MGGERESMRHARTTDRPTALAMLPYLPVRERERFGRTNGEGATAYEHFWAGRACISGRRPGHVNNSFVRPPRLRDNIIDIWPRSHLTPKGGRT